MILYRQLLGKWFDPEKILSDSLSFIDCQGISNISVTENIVLAVSLKSTCERIDQLEKRIDELERKARNGKT